MNTEHSLGVSRATVSLITDTPMLMRDPSDETKAELPPEPAPVPGYNEANLKQSDSAPGMVDAAVPAKRHRFRPHVRPVHIHVRVRTFDSMRYRSYRLLWAATVASSSGSWLQQIVIGWLTYHLTQSAFWTSIVLGLDSVPILLAGPLGGLMVDRWDRRKLLAGVYLYQAVLTSSFATLVMLGDERTWHIFVYILLLGFSWVITDPARMSLIPNIVPRAKLVNAFSLNGLAFSITRFVVPALGGVLLALVGAGAALALMAAMQASACALVLGMRIEPSVRPRLRLTAAFSELLEGARYVRGDTVILGLFLLGTIPSLLVMPFVHGLMPVYAAEVFGVGPRGLGLLLSSIGAGATIGTVVLASFTNIGRQGRLILICVVVMGLSMVLFAKLPFVGMVFPILGVLSAGMAVFYAILTTMVQSAVSDDLRGRVSGLFMLAWGVLPVGSLVAGVLAQELGAPTATLIAVGLGAVALTAIVLKFRSLWSLT